MKFNKAQVSMHFSKLKLPLFIVTCLLPGTVKANETVHFEQQIAPIIAEHCLSCHSPGIDKGDLSLATITGLLTKEFIVAGDPDSSYLLDLITSQDDAKPSMPKEGKPLSPEQVELIRLWIKQGAHWPEDVIVREPSKADKSWWALQPLAQTAPPQPEKLPQGWDQNQIDSFVYQKLVAQNLLPNPKADRRTLIRRATYDLTGLPPTPEKVHAFINEPDPNAYEHLIDELLASPRYGERWGRHWLDVVRFGESNGFERNVVIEDLWPFRDYVIDSFNADKPFDQMIKEHIAGDVLAPDEPDVVTGAAFLVSGPYDDVGNQDAAQAAQIRADTLDEMIRTTSEAFLGMTIGCARCHDHKFDPILQSNYYHLYATFSGVKHGSRVVATPEEKQQRAALVGPLEEERNTLTKERDALSEKLNQRAEENSTEHEKLWVREPVSRTGTEETFEPVSAKIVRFTSLALDTNPNTANGFGIDEFEIWSNAEVPQNVALASSGSSATGPSRVIEDFPGAYGPQLVIDGKLGARFIATSHFLQIELPNPRTINRIIFSSAKNESQPEQDKFKFVADYRIEVSLDGNEWKEVAHGRDRKPVNEAHRKKRLNDLERNAEDQKQLATLTQQINAITSKINAIPPLKTIWVGNHSDFKQPQHVFIGGSPQHPGEVVSPASPNILFDTSLSYELSNEASDAERRLKLADWIANSNNPLTVRVLVNRLWHYHFGTGIVDTPNDFGYMGGRPTHPELLDWLGQQLLQNGWKLKSLHKQIMLSQTYQQSSDFREEAAAVDGDSRLLWRFPPRRLSAEEIRDTMLSVAGQLKLDMGGPGFRLYRYLQDNVATYVPLDANGPETYRRAVYHQNARAARTDLMSDFDQPDCAFSSPRRAETTTPLQALSTMNHAFTLDMAQALATRLQVESSDNLQLQISQAWNLCYSRTPSPEELANAEEFVNQHSLSALCRVLFNTSELIYLD